MDTPLKDMLNDMNKTKESLLDSIKNSKDVKEGILTEEEAVKEPENIVFLHIMDTVIDILNNKELGQLYKKMEEEGTSAESIKSLINLIAIVTTNATYSSILFYDDLMKKELSRQFDHMGGYINNLTADIKGIKAACEVYNKKIGTIENELKINKIKEEKI